MPRRALTSRLRDTSVPPSFYYVQARPVARLRTVLVKHDPRNITTSNHTRTQHYYVTNDYHNFIHVVYDFVISHDTSIITLFNE
jgi:hypothetical protein